MGSRLLKLWMMIALLVVTSWSPAANRMAADTGLGPAFSSIGPLTFGPDGTLFAADPQAASIFAVDLGQFATGGAQGAKDVPGIDQKIAAMLGTDAREIAVTDLAVHPRTRNAFVSVMRGQGAGAAAVLMRIDGAGKIEMVALPTLRYSRVTLPNAPDVNSTNPRNTRAQSITDMAFVDGRLYVAGLSNEEFSSKLRSLPYPFASADRGTSVEIYHGNHGQLETRSPVYAFVPYTVNNTPHLIAGYICTPLVKFPISGLTPGAKVRGTTIAELGNRNRPLDMVLYRKDGKEFLLMSNNSRGVMKIPTARFGNASAIDAPVTAETGGVPYETVTKMKGIEQLDLLDAQNTLVLARAETGTLNLEVVPLP
jgi:hypothetical protein